MCVVCWAELDLESGGGADLGCGHFACSSCLAGLRTCPVCHAEVQVSQPLASTAVAQRGLAGIKHWAAVSPRRRWLTAVGDAAPDTLLADDHLAPGSTLGSADTATPPRLHMLESAPSSAGGSQSNLPVVFAHPHHPHGHGHHGHGQPHPRPDRLGAVLSARHLAHGGFRAGRVLVMHGVLPAARASALASRMALHATGRVALATGRALLGTAQRLQRFAMAPRVRVAQVDGAACLDPMQLVRLGSGDPAAMAVAAAAVAAAAPPPIANLTGARIALRHCRNTRLRIEYCSDCVVVASRLSNCELMLVGCTRIKLVLRDCSGLLLRELQCGSMGDFERRRCEGFSHEIVCLRCACKPSGSGGASPSTSEGVRMLTY